MNSDLYTKVNIIQHLQDIKKSLRNDIEPVIDLYMEHFFKTNEGIGLFAIPRMIFPEIDNLGAYYSGTIKNTPKYAIRFIKDYFSRVNLEYLNKGAFIYLVYRHGLMHQHTPKLLSYKRKSIGWAIHLSSNKVVTTHTHLGLLGKTVQIDGRQLYEDLLFALDFYINDIKNERKNLIENFSKAHKEMKKPLSKTLVLQKYINYIKQRDLQFLK